ncbi:MAG: CAP domain-containing protein [Acidobacteria bacterium]|nr:CAP domain-containing protein [Acidobacteriota bacterium]
MTNRKPPRMLAVKAQMALILVCLVAVPAGMYGAGTLSAPGLVEQTNDVRSRSGLGTLTLNPLLSQAAQAKALDMGARGYFSHTTPDGLSAWDLITAAGYEFQAAAENLAVGLGSDDVLVTAWMASPGHRHNILNERYTEIGIGIARGRYKGQDTIFVVQLFGKPKRVIASSTSR